MRERVLFEREERKRLVPLVDVQDKNTADDQEDGDQVIAIGNFTSDAEKFTNGRTINETG